MSEVSSWSETDESNTAAPPNGWPEFMIPSDVNNCARAMMGAIKRWYNTVSAGIANALPLSGGTMTGPLVAPSITSTGNIAAGLDISCRTVYASSTVQALQITSTGAINAATDIAGRALYLTAGINAPGSIVGGYIHSAGNLDVDGTLTAGVLGGYHPASMPQRERQPQREYAWCSRHNGAPVTSIP